MKWLFGVFLVAVLAWCGYWYAGSTLIEREARAWFDRQAAEGRVASHKGITVAGFASRFDLTITEPHLADPASGYGWQAPAAKVYAMTWKPWHVLAALPSQQTITLPDQSITLASSAFNASLRAKPSTDVPLAETRIIAQDLVAQSSRAWTFGLDSLAMALRAAPDTAASYDLGVEVQGIRPDAQLLARLKSVQLPQMPPAPLPDSIARLHIDARLTLTSALDRFAPARKPRLQGVELREFRIVWGEMDLSASGTIAPDAQGFAAGEIELSMKGWQHLPVVLVAGGVISDRIAPSITNMLGAVAKDGGDGSTVTFPLKLQDGWMSFGPLPLGPAPHLGIMPG